MASGSTNNHYAWGASSGYRSDGFGPTYAAPLMKVGARYYDPEFGCFLTRDTVLTEKPYAYCDGDPVNRADPTGHNWILVVVVIVVGGVAIYGLYKVFSALGNALANLRRQQMRNAGGP